MVVAFVFYVCDLRTALLPHVVRSEADYHNYIVQSYNSERVKLSFNQRCAANFNQTLRIVAPDAIQPFAPARCQNYRFHSHCLSFILHCL